MVASRIMAIMDGWIQLIYNTLNKVASNKVASNKVASNKIAPNSVTLQTNGQ